MNISPEQVSGSSADARPLADLFHLLAQPVRLRILLAIGASQPCEACVCHLEVALGLRQANISQQLMLLRDAGLVTTSRDGRNIYYRLADPRLLELIAAAAHLLGVPLPADDIPQPAAPLPGCPCPHCAEASGIAPAQARQITCDPGP